MKRVAVVVLSWNALPLLKRYLPVLLRYTSSELAEVIVADNGSDDQSSEYARGLGCGVITLPQNYGFAKGYNKAIQQLGHEYVLLLNNDVRVTEGWLEPLVHFLDTQRQAVAVQPKVRWDRNPASYEYAGAEGGYLDYLGYPFCRGRIFDTLEVDRGQYGSAPKEVFWATGAAMLVRRQAFVDEGGFDERFFAHQEEIDLCWRWQSQGFGIFVVPQSVVYHYGGASLSAENPHKTYLNFRNNRWMLQKNLPSGRRRPILLVRTLLDLLAALTFLFQGKAADAKAVLRALTAKRPDTCPKYMGDKRRAYDQLYPHPILIRYHLYKEKRYSQLR